jgi:hypothetical protein
MLKFHGHFLETTGRLHKQGHFRPTRAQAQVIERSKAHLDWAVGELLASGVYDRLGELKKTQPQLHLDLIGDACHGAHGLEYWKR